MALVRGGLNICVCSHFNYAAVHILIIKILSPLCDRYIILQQRLSHFISKFQNMNHKTVIVNSFA